VTLISTLLFRSTAQTNYAKGPCGEPVIIFCYRIHCSSRISWSVEWFVTKKTSGKMFLWGFLLQTDLDEPLVYNQKSWADQINRTGPVGKIKLLSKPLVIIIHHLSTDEEILQTLAQQILSAHSRSCHCSMHKNKSTVLCPQKQSLKPDKN